MSLIETRGYQMFPVLDAGQIETAKRFASGPPRDFAPGETVFGVGERNVPSWLVLKGSIDAIGRDGRGVETHITTHHAGQFSGELSQLAGRQSLAMGKAGTDGATAIPFDDAHVRALMIGSAEIGEIMMRAFILRRVGLIDEGKAGSTLVGTAGNPDLARIEGFLARNGYPYTVLDPEEDQEAGALLDRAGISADELPVMFCPNGQVLRRPNESEAAACLGILPNLDLDKLYDVAVVGAGPAGRAAAVYAASEGLSVMVFDTRAFGGQAGASARIENYFGFPTGINGMKLTARGLQPGTQIRRRGGHSAGSEEARLRRTGLALLSLAHARTQRRRGGAGKDRRDRLGSALPQAGHSKSRRFRGSRGVLLGDLCRGEALRRRGGCRWPRGRAAKAAHSGYLPRPGQRRDASLSAPPCVPVHRRRPQHRLA